MCEIADQQDLKLPSSILRFHHCCPAILFLLPTLVVFQFLFSLDTTLSSDFPLSLSCYDFGLHPYEAPEATSTIVELYSSRLLSFSRQLAEFKFLIIFDPPSALPYLNND